jgi:hypothetical protein
LERVFLLKKLINGVALIHTGPVELAAVGVSIALFNQVSRIAIFPLVSVTTSFVAEEDTIGRVGHEAQDREYLETGSTTNSEDKELIPKNGILSSILLFTLYAFLMINIGFSLLISQILFTDSYIT